MTKYSYTGPVMSFNKCLINNWSGTTTAASERKARSNLEYQYKKSNNLLASAKISFPGKMTSTWEEN